MDKGQVTEDLNIKPDTLNQVEEKVENSLEVIDKEDNFLNRLSIAQVLRSVIINWNLMKMKSFPKANNTINRTNWQPIGGKRFL